MNTKERFLHVLDKNNLYDYFDYDELNYDTILFGEFGIYDSLDKISIMIGIENEFNFDITDVEAYDIETYGDIVNLLKEKGVGHNDVQY